MEIFDYDNILLLPRKCRVDSRADCDPTIEFGGRRFALPVVPANMRTVIDERIVEMLARTNHFYVMHRFDLDAVAFAQGMRDKGLLVSISVGSPMASTIRSAAVAYIMGLSRHESRYCWRLISSCAVAE